MTRAWGLKLPWGGGGVAPFILLSTRAPVIAWTVWNYGDTGTQKPEMWATDFDRKVWAKLYRRGFRVVPVVVREVSKRRPKR